MGRGIAAAQRSGDVIAYGFLSVIRSHVALYAGRLLDSEADARAALGAVGQGAPDTQRVLTSMASRATCR